MPDLRLICGALAGVAVTLGVLVAWLRWRQGRGRRKGRRGEKEVARRLKKFLRRECIVLNDLMLRFSDGRTSQVDHLVLSIHGLFVIETKSLSGRIVGGEREQYWRQYLPQKMREFYNPCLQNERHVRVLRRLLPDVPPEYWVSMVVFTEAWRLQVSASDVVEKRRWLPDRRIRRTLRPGERRKRRWWNPGREVRLDEGKIVVSIDELVDEISRRKQLISWEELEEIRVKVLAAVVTGRQAEREHRRMARDTSRSIEAQIRRGICPRCGGRLRIVQGEKGEFAGCENYPGCTFACSIDRLRSDG